MPSFVASFTVNAPLDAVAGYLADPLHRPDWDVTVASIAADDHDPARWDQLVAFYGKRLPFRLERTVAGPEHIAFRGTHRSAVLEERFALERCATGTEVTYEADVRLTGALRFLDKGLDSAFAALKAKSVTRLTRSLDAGSLAP